MTNSETDTLTDRQARTVELVQRSLSPETAATFRDRLETQADWLRAAIEAGRFDNDDLAVGLELEAYAVVNGEPKPQLARLPEAVFEEPAANKELGRHNIEINTEPTLLSETGLTAQADEIRKRTTTARAAAAAHDREIVLDAMWTLPPAAGAADYLSATTDHDGVVVADNMRGYPRYVAIDNDVLAHADGEVPFSVPGVAATFPSILFESLATSIQPHLQIPTAAELPAYYNAAIRTLGPVLALTTNSPFLPTAFYDAADDPGTVIDETPHELRIDVFEQSVNQTEHAKVRVPSDIETTTDVVDRVVADDPYAPFLREWLADDDRETLADRIWEFDHKRGTYWRWLRCVVGGAHIDNANDTHSLRIEYRPIPTQPTVTDIVGLQALVAGAIYGLADADHPIRSLPWADAEASFYNAAADGIDADLRWVTADGERTTDSDAIFAELFEYARRGLATAGIGSDAIDSYLAPIEARVTAGMTPSVWKKQQVRERFADGDDLRTAIEGMQQAYIKRSRETDSFADWV